MISRIRPYLEKGYRILDIGSGSCHIAKRLKDEGYSVVPLDVKDKSCFDEITPAVYDGKKIPFPDSSFDVSLLVTALHHIREPVSIMEEAKRVSPRIIIIEDLHSSIFQKYLTFAMDSILNREFFGHPHSNKTEAEWGVVFRDLGLRVVDKRISRFWKFFTSGVFYLERE